MADTFHFPADFLTCPETSHYQQAINQLRLGIRDGGSGCFRNKPLIAAASYSALAVTIKWLHKTPNRVHLACTTIITDPSFLHKPEHYIATAMESPSSYSQPFSRYSRQKYDTPANTFSNDYLRMANTPLSHARRFWTSHKETISYSIYKAPHSPPTTKISFDSTSYFTVVPVFSFATQYQISAKSLAVLRVIVFPYLLL